MTENLSTIRNITMVASRTGTCHLVGPAGWPPSGRIKALCGFSLWPDDGPFEALRDCEFCRQEAAEAEIPQTEIQ